MAGTSATLPIQETDLRVLKETLLCQQKLLQKLYAELDVERESSATAANEAMSMILRLQTEKGALKMEASQYKRLAEQKIGHAEESLAILEELIYQKEMEISSLGFQVQAYRYKLLSIGFDDLNDNFQRYDTFNRLSSLPVHDSSSSQGLDSRRDSAGDFNSYLEQIIILDEKVKEISKTSSLNECHDIKSDGDSLERPISSSACSSSVVHDVFEVPEASAKSKICFDEEKCNGKSISESDDRLTKPDCKPRDDLPTENGTECVKINKVLSSNDQTKADSISALMHRGVHVTDHQSELKQLSQRVEQLESRRNNTSHEIVEGREEKLELLKELREELNSLQSEVRSCRPKEKTPSPSDEANLVALTEAMMYSWL